MQNNTKILKLTDFGLSRVAFKRQKVIENRYAAGTLAYMSPKLLKFSHQFIPAPSPKWKSTL